MVFKGQFQTPQEATTTSHEKLIEFFKEKGLSEEVNDLRNNGTILNFRYTNLGDVGAKLIAEAIRFNNSIAHLDLGYNNIGNAGIREIAVVLKFNNSITYLNLSGNKIDETGIKELSESLKFNNSITYLNLYGNDIGVEESKLIKSYLERNKNLAEKTGKSLDAKDSNFYNQEKYKAEVTSIKKIFYRTESTNIFRK
ncbi:hypothetical protein N7281_07430 [Rickettsia hoogstraalii]|uniref:hypothetical protein n=1 Tax=Rickettsia hoogstraalii TaxID=467174 RepID=UPI0022553EDF|nr:hypothetical protein [Rickettsia hoogstraalii]MCX4084637.1 hypothetical protein [Rickettsia hoogstraalii]